MHYVILGMFVVVVWLFFVVVFLLLFLKDIDNTSIPIQTYCIKVYDIHNKHLFELRYASVISTNILERDVALW